MKLVRLNAILDLIALAIFLLGVDAVWAADNFTPIETPAAASATTTSSSTSFSLTAAINAPDVKVCNQGSTIAYWVCGNSSVQACLPGAGCSSTEIDANKCGAYHKGIGATTCAAITPSSSTTVAFTAGEGS